MAKRWKTYRPTTPEEEAQKEAIYRAIMERAAYHAEKAREEEEREAAATRQ